MKPLRCLVSLSLSMALLGPLGASSAQAQLYADVPVGHWAESVIAQARDLGLMQGQAENRFGLGRILTRAEFVTILSRMFAWEGHDMGQTFADVPANQWYYESVELAAAAGVLDTTLPFRPEEPITRLEMAELLVDALGYDQLGDAQRETVFVDGENRGALALAYDIGMTTGVERFGKLYFLPEDNASREEAAAMLVRVYNRLFSPTDWLHGFYAFSSYSQIGLASAMDEVSVGWARLALNEGGEVWINSTRTDNNEWVKPTDYTDARDVFTSTNTLVNLNIFCSDADTFLTPEAREAAVAAIVSESVDYHGITMDVEGSDMRDDSVKQPYTDFLRAIRAALPADKSLYVCVPPNTWYHGYDYAALGEICDKVILMAHDYQWTSVPDSYLGTGKTTNPVTPIGEIYTTLKAITDPETGVADRSRIALQISFAQVGLQVDENGLLCSQTIYTPAPSTVYKRLLQEDSVLSWSQEHMNPYLDYTTEDGSHYRLWYEDERSVAAKVRLAHLFDIHSLSLWRLGTIPNWEGEGLYYNVWDSLADGLAQKE